MRQKLIVAMCLAITSLAANAQWWTNGNNLNNDGILGLTSNFNIDFQTNGVTRMSLMRTGTTAINGYNINTSGFLGLSTAPAFFTPAWNMPGTPFALLHLNGENLPDGVPVQLGYRDWMQNGIVFTHNKDFMYVGPRKMGTDQTDATITWGDNTTGSGNGPDNLTFVCTSGTGSGTSGQSSYSGLEIARLTTAGRMGVGTAWTNTFQPQRTLDVIDQSNTPQFRITRARNTNVNLGTNADFMVNNIGHLFINTRFSGSERNIGFGLNGLVDTPTEKLDINGTIRLRNMPSASPKVLITGIPQNNTPNDLQLNYLSFPDDPGLVLAGNATWVPFTNSPCDWNIVGSQNLCMGYVGACNEGKVGIGTASPTAKSEIYYPGTEGQYTVGETIIVNGGGDMLNSIIGENIRVAAVNFVNNVYGLYSRSQSNTTSDSNYAMYARAVNGKKSTGVYSYATSNDQAVAVAGIADPNATTSYGLYGQGGGSNPTNAALYLNGSQVSGNMLNFSDYSMKTDIQQIESGLEIVQALKPSKYYFTEETVVDFHLSSDLQYGFIAQEVQEVLPSLVRSYKRPEFIDEETGEYISTSVEHLAMDYIAIIPILTKAIQEQQEMINSLQGQVNALATTVASCCAMDAETKNSSFDIKMEVPQSSLNQNFPNPFDVSTSISYTVGCACDVQINIYDQSGRLISNLVSGPKEQGNYSVEWNATGVTSGIYFYTLVVDGQEFVKRAIKL